MIQQIKLSNIIILFISFLQINCKKEVKILIPLIAHIQIRLLKINLIKLIIKSGYLIKYLRKR